jgi:hypothetical protein
MHMLEKKQSMIALSNIARVNFFHNFWREKSSFHLCRNGTILNTIEHLGPLNRIDLKQTTIAATVNSLFSVVFVWIVTVTFYLMEQTMMSTIQYILHNQLHW